MNTKKYRNYLVIWSPLNHPAPVDRMKIIDAFASTDTLAQVRDFVEVAAGQGEYSDHGEGIIMVVDPRLVSWRIET